MSISSAPIRNTTSISPLAAPSRMPATSRPPSAGSRPRSRPPTRAAAVWSTLKPFQSLAGPCRERSATPRGEAQDGGPIGSRERGPCPRSRGGVLRPTAAPRRSCGPPSSQVGERLRRRLPGPSTGVGEVERRPERGRRGRRLPPALADARVDDWRLPARVGADEQGGRRRSSRPAMVVLNRYSGPHAALSLAPSWRQSTCGEPSRSASSLTITMVSQSTRSPTMNATLPPSRPSSRARTAANASRQSLTWSLPPFFTIGTSRRRRRRPS